MSNGEIDDIKVETTKQTGSIIALADQEIRHHNENRDDHQQLFSGQSHQRERITVCETRIGVMEPKLNCMSNTKAKLNFRLGELKTWIKLATVLVLGAGGYFLSMLLANFLGD